MPDNVIQFNRRDREGEEEGRGLVYCPCGGAWWVLDGAVTFAPDMAIGGWSGSPVCNSCGTPMGIHPSALPPTPTGWSVTQGILRDDPEVRTDDCLRAALASLLDTDPEKIPRFAEQGVGWVDAMYAWCEEQGYQVIYRDPHFPAARGVAYGLSSRGVEQVAVMTDGRIAHDCRSSRPALAVIISLYELVPLAADGPDPLCPWAYWDAVTGTTAYCEDASTHNRPRAVHHGYDGEGVRRTWTSSSCWAYTEATG